MFFCTIAIGCGIDLSLGFKWLSSSYVMDDADPRFSSNVNISFIGLNEQSGILIYISKNKDILATSKVDGCLLFSDQL